MRCVGPTGRWKRIFLKRYREKVIRDADRDDAEEVSSVVHQTCHHVNFVSEAANGHPVGLSHYSGCSGSSLEVIQ